MSKILVGVLFLCLPLLMTSCDDLFGVMDNPMSPGLKVSTPTIQVEKGKTFKCNAKASSRTKLVYTSADPSIATVDSYGMITGVAEGKTTITVTTEGKDSQAKSIFTIESLTIPVEVVILEVLVESVKLDKTELTVTLGDDPVKLVATVNPDNADSKTVVWTTSDEEVATVDDKGEVTFVGGGTATITATATNGTTDSADDKTAECEVTVNKKAGSMSYPKTSETVGVSKDDFVNPITIEGDGTVTYSSSDTSIAEVDSKTGVITPHKAGTVTIKATIADGKTTTYETKEIKYTLKVNYPYMKWDETTKTLVEADPLDETTATIMPAESTLTDGPASSKLLPEGKYIIAEDMTFDETLRLSGDVDFILCDGKTLTMNGTFYGYDGTDFYKLNIYGQSDNSGKLIIKNCMGAFKPLNIYGGQIDATASWGGAGVIGDVRGMNVYGGKVKACNTSSSGGYGIKMTTGTYTLTIYGGEVTAQGPNVSSSYANSIGISGNDVEVNGGKLVAISQASSSDYGKGIYGNLTVNGGSVEVNSSVGTAVFGTITAGAGVLEESDDNSTWTTITGTSSTKKYIRTKP